MSNACSIIINVDKYYKTKVSLLKGTSYKVLQHNARVIQGLIVKNPKRQPYVKCKAMGSSKVFLDEFWVNISHRSLPDKMRRIVFFACALDLLQNSNVKPVELKNPKTGRPMYEFCGVTSGGVKFKVHVQEFRARGYFFMSVFPERVRL